ncbi:preprotein translocase subunit SecD [Stella humosa]|uniref:Protein translocase subunit SecD n=1 Tax=Stella humosa TaxID=94 RepID=A0A3N1M832_9PROT|nr:protein translocase subunit SecD [Stella humosa]ROP99872.1 preprotein translocase subunit SecD [Stella humosa]BBK30899.1 protein translocase subunit SecD [Stella humosa]
MLIIPRWKAVVILLVALAGLLYAAPNLLPRQVAESLPNWLPHQQVSLGLDLQGGSHLLLEVDTAFVVRERIANLQDVVRTAFRQPQIGYADLAARDDAVTFTLRDPTKVEEARRLLREGDAEAEIAAGADGRFTLRYPERVLNDLKRAAVDQSIEIVRRRVDETGTKEPSVQRQGTDRILLQLPGIDDPQRVKQLLGRTAKMTFRLVDMNAPIEEARRGRLPPGTELLPSEERDGGQARQYVVQRRAMVSGDMLTNAQAGNNSQTGEWVVNFRFDSNGARRFGDVTKANVGRLFAIVLDGKVISAPVIREAILGGSGQISGSFTAQSANDLALLLRAGALPAPLNVLEERTVGPDLGSDSIQAGTIACIVGYLLICVLMVLGYGFFGLIANIALLLNLIITLAVMSVLQATLTLPGIAGLVLSLAMAVDANVLIYERIREETALGRTPFSAVDAGFSRAFLTILDSNLTTLIASVLLYAFGSGPVRGFAVTLSIGIIASMFTAISLTRLIVVFWLKRARPAALPI